MTATAMDLIFASEDAKFVPSPTHQFQTLPWDMPIRKAKEIVFEHRVVPAREARDLGLVNRIYPRKTLEKETLAYANRVAENLRQEMGIRGATPRERRLGRPSTALENLKIKEETELK
ncbi:MAG: enoyl-CoA hydratase [Dehalococcoidales bacterium]|nr:enoyl-CoA hydratase [Dehalococcoidales bacterium]